MCRINSYNALPVFAITGFRFCYKTNGKPYILAPIGVPNNACLGLSGGVPGASLGGSAVPSGSSFLATRSTDYIGEVGFSNDSAEPPDQQISPVESDS